MGYGLNLKYSSQGHVLDASSQLGALFGEVLETWGGMLYIELSMFTMECGEFKGLI